MTIAQLVQLYAPLAGLLILAFWTGALSNRVYTLERDAKRAKETDDRREDGDKSVSNRLLKLETTFELEMSAVKTELKHIAREFAGVQRQLANAAKSGGKIIEFGSDPG